MLDLSQPPRLDAAAIVDALPRSLFQSCPCEGEVLEGTLVGDPIEDGAGDGFAQLAEVIEDLSGIPIGSPPLSEVCGDLPPRAFRGGNSARSITKNEVARRLTPDRRCH